MDYDPAAIQARLERMTEKFLRLPHKEKLAAIREGIAT